MDGIPLSISPLQWSSCKAFSGDGAGGILQEEGALLKFPTAAKWGSVEREWAIWWGLWPSHTSRIHGPSVPLKPLPGLAITYLRISQFRSLPEGLPTHSVPQLPSVGPTPLPPADWRFITELLLPASSASPHTACLLLRGFLLRQAGPAKLIGNLKGSHSLSIPTPLVAACFPTYTLESCLLLT